MASSQLRFARPALLAAIVGVVLILAACAMAQPGQPAVGGNGTEPAGTPAAAAAASQIPATSLAPPAVPTLTVELATGTPSATATLVISAAPPGALPGTGGSTSISPTPTSPAICAPTAPDQLGPFYKPNAPERSSVGQGHVLSGVVRSSADCSPIAGARIELWMANPNAQYDDAHRATMYSDASGAYRFDSNVPVPYTGRPPHIHVMVTAEGFKKLVTQYYPPAGSTAGTFDLVLEPAQ